MHPDRISCGVHSRTWRSAWCAGDIAGPRKGTSVDLCGETLWMHWGKKERVELVFCRRMPRCHFQRQSIDVLHQNLCHDVMLFRCLRWNSRRGAADGLCFTTSNGYVRNYLTIVQPPRLAQPKVCGSASSFHINNLLLGFGLLALAFFFFFEDSVSKLTSDFTCALGVVMVEGWKEEVG